MRRYRIGEYTYDHDTGNITSAEGTSTLRAKSNDVLFLFLQNPRQLLSKSAILQKVWDDVAAQEHVLFQSIKEIRQCFENLDVIKTHPRKGYEWIAPISETVQCDEPQQITEETQTVSSTLSEPGDVQPPVATDSNKWPAAFAVVAICTLLIVILGWNTTNEQGSVSKIDETTATNPRFVELVITPVRIKKPQDNLTNWVPIGAMDMLIQKMQQTPIDRMSGGIMVVGTEDVLEALKRANARDIEDQEIQSRQLRHNMGEITSLHTELYGSPMEYSLKYKLINRTETRQGLLTGESVVQLINQLASSLPELLQMQATEPFLAYEQRFANDAFIFGLSHYYENDFTKAADYFRTAIAAGDQFPQSRRYLAKSIAAQGQFEQAAQLAQEAIEFGESQQNPEEILRSLFELGVNQWRIGKFQQAKQNIEKTQTLAKEGKDLLYLAFAIEMLGHFALENHQLNEAQHYFSQALEYHQGFRCPYGLSSNYVNLSNVAMLKGEISQGNEFLDSALSIARQNELVYFETRIHLLMARESLAQNNPESAGLHLNFAQSLVDKYPNKGAQRVLNNWPESADTIF